MFCFQIRGQKRNRNTQKWPETFRNIGRNSEVYSCTYMVYRSEVERQLGRSAESSSVRRHRRPVLYNAIHTCVCILVTPPGSTQNSSSSSERSSRSSSERVRAAAAASVSEQQAACRCAVALPRTPLPNDFLGCKSCPGRHFWGARAPSHREQVKHRKKVETGCF